MSNAYTMTDTKKEVISRRKTAKKTLMAKQHGLITFSEIADMLQVSSETLRRKTMTLLPKMRKNGQRKRLYTPKEAERVINYVIKTL